MLQINASIVKHKSRLYCSYRTTHLYQYDSKSFISELDSDLNVIWDKNLVAENDNTAFEDVRLFSIGEDLLAFYTYFPKIEEGKWEWVYGVGFGIVDIDAGTMTNQLSLRTMSRRLHEKNWCPFIFDDNLYMLTDIDPFIRIIHIGNYKNASSIKEWYISKIRTISWSYGELRGGTPFISKPDEKNGWLYGFIHSYLSESKGFDRYYYFTVARLNGNTMELQYYPVPLQYDENEYDEQYKLLWNYSNNMKLKVIFPIGIAHLNDDIIVSFGIDDVCSSTQIYTWDYLESLFSNT